MRIAIEKADWRIMPPPAAAGKQPSSTAVQTLGEDPLTTVAHAADSHTTPYHRLDRLETGYCANFGCQPPGAAADHRTIQTGKGGRTRQDRTGQDQTTHASGGGSPGYS